MTVTVNSRQDFTLANLHRVAFAGESVRLGEQARARMGRTRSQFMDLINNDPTAFVYGVTSGYGMAAKTRLNPEQRRIHAARPARALGITYGRRMEPRLVRAIVFARLANYVEGNAAARPVIAERVAAMLDGRPLPDLSLDGAVSAGEILPLGELFAHLFGDGNEEKESGTFANGSPVSSAMLGEAAILARGRLDMVAHVFALSIEAFDAPLAAYDEALDDLWGDAHDAAALSGLRRLLAGGRTERRPYQAPVSFRVLPRVLGQAHRAVAQAEQQAATMLAAITDNPVYIPPEHPSNGGAYPHGRAISTGGYHSAAAAPALDALAQSWADLQAIADRHTTKMHMGRVSLLPDGLRSDDHPFSTMALGFVQGGFSEMARHNAHTTFLPTGHSGGSTQDDVACVTPIAYIKEQATAHYLMLGLAGLAVVASQALHVTGRDVAPPLTDFLAAVRRLCPPIASLRHVGHDCERVAEAMAGAVVRGDTELWQEQVMGFAGIPGPGGQS
ncbi:MAG: aromatic amino acid lyase [Alphaproteobacteria bacterium]